jgi:hypothetical protein
VGAFQRACAGGLVESEDRYMYGTKQKVSNESIINPKDESKKQEARVLSFCLCIASNFLRSPACIHWLPSRLRPPSLVLLQPLLLPPPSYSVAASISNPSVLVVYTHGAPPPPISPCRLPVPAPAPRSPSP